MRILDMNLIVKQDEIIDKTDNGIIINTRKLRQFKPDTGVVLYVSDKCTQVKPGDKVAFGKYAGINVEIDEEEFIMFAEKEIDVIMENAELTEAQKILYDKIINASEVIQAAADKKLDAQIPESWKEELDWE